MTGATETITNFQSGDTLNFTNQNGITGSYASGVLTLTGSRHAGQYTGGLAVGHVLHHQHVQRAPGPLTSSPTTARTQSTSNTGVDTVVVGSPPRS